MRFFHWFNGPKANLSPQQKFAADMRATLLSAARALLLEDRDLMRLTAFMSSYCGIITIVRKVYGVRIADEKSLAMQIITGFGKDKEAGNKFDWFMSKLREAKGNDEAASGSGT
jgi:hypothetical protein